MSMHFLVAKCVNDRQKIVAALTFHAFLSLKETKRRHWKKMGTQKLKRSPWEGPRGSGSPNEDPLGHSALQVEAVQTLAKPFGVLYRHLDKVGPLKVQKIHFSSLSLNWCISMIKRFEQQTQSFLSMMPSFFQKFLASLLIQSSLSPILQSKNW